MRTVVMPQLGQSVDEWRIVRWHKRVGERVRVDEVLFDLETEAGATEIPSLDDGVITEIDVMEGQSAKVGTILARIGDTGD
ncbi:MAG: biotin/lipoyl-containing protein [Candidatus Velthaea sp.]